MRNYGMHARTILRGGEQSSARYGARNTGAGSYSYPPLPAESIFHLEDVSHPPFEIPARIAVVGFVGFLIFLFIAAYYGVSLLFGV